MDIARKTRSAVRIVARPFLEAREQRRKAPLYTSPHGNLDPELHLREAAQWLTRAEDFGTDRGVSYGAEFGEGFLPILSVAVRPCFTKRSLSISDTRERLVRCFQAVFPNLSEAEALRANVHRVGAWDSVATTTLAAAVEEQFNVQFEAREIEKLTSFQAFLDRLDRA